MAAGRPSTLRRHLSISLLSVAILLHIPAALSLDPEDQTTTSRRPYDTFSFPSFASDINGTDFIVLKDAGVNQGALQLTPDTINDIDYLLNKSGRVLLHRPFILWEPRTAENATTNYVASFNTSFTVNIYRPKGEIAGEGFAFLIAPNLDPPPPGSEGGFLGLTNATLDGDADNHLVAVEFDTVKQSYDPNSNHVGIDINTIKSNITADLPLEISPVNGTNYTVWVDYDGAARRIWAYIAVAGGRKPSTPVLAAPLDLSQHVLQKSYLGFSGSTGTDYELNCVLAWNLTVERLSDGNGGAPAWKLVVMIGIPAAAVAVAALLAGLLLGWRTMKRRRMRGSCAFMAESLRSLPGMPREFEYKELQKATNNFDDGMKLGQGGFGEVYRGKLAGEDGDVAVKRFSRDGSRHDDFIKELAIINRLRHRHLVRLVGWCYKNGVLLLVYDYMVNGSLDQHLYGGAADAPLLDWDRRYNILTGVASALHYLHYEYDQKVVHRDLKSSNILLDAAFNARLGDFGLARTIDTDKTSYAELELGGVPGTMGYIAPECFHTGTATRESDIYGFGAVILEVACGRRPRIEGFQLICDWVWKLHQEGRVLDAMDRRLGEDFVSEDAERLLLLGLACRHPKPSERPKAPEIVQVMSRYLAAPSVPPVKPRFMWPAGPMEEDGDEGRSRSASSLFMTSLSSTSYKSSTEYSSPKILA